MKQYTLSKQEKYARVLSPYSNFFVKASVVSLPQDSYMFTASVEHDVLNARYYEGSRGQFISQDPEFRDSGFDLNDPQSMNSYSYARNNPIAMIDRNGEMFEYFSLYLAAHHYINHSPIVPHSIRQADFAITNPVAAYRIGAAYDNGTGKNISTTASNFAINITKDESSVKDTNAIRHTVWQSIISREFGLDTATKVGNAHENNPFVDLSNRTFSDRNSADQTADLLNNQIGRSIYLNNPNATNVEYAQNAVEYMYTNGLYTVSSQNGNFIVSQIKMDSSQRNAALNTLSGLKNNGLKK